MTRAVMLIILFAMFALGGWYLWRERQKDLCSQSGGEWNQAAGACGPRSG